jgi:amidase
MKLPEYDEMDAIAQAEWVSSGEVSASELLEAAIERVEMRNPALNAVVHTCFERARKRVGGLPEGPLRGVPFLVKNLGLQVTGTPTTDSCRLYAGHIASEPSVLTERYEAAGLQIIGKTNTPEFGIMGTTEPEMYGPSRNPWNPEHTPGGSSGGSAAAVAARMVAVAHGGDGGGSLRIPASCCGLFGLKPTRGRVSLAPFAAEGWGGLVQHHVISRSVRDSALLLDIADQPTVGEPYASPAKAGPFLDEVGRPPGRLRIAFETGALFGDDSHPDCVAAVEKAVGLLQSLGHEVVEDTPPFDRDALVRAYFILVSAGVAREVEAAAEAGKCRMRSADFEVATWMLAQIGWCNTASEYLWAREVIQRESRRVAQWFSTVDVFCCPTLGRPPAVLGELLPDRLERAQLAVLRILNLRPLLQKALSEIGKGKLAYTPNTQLFNQTGQPAMSVPLFWNEAGLPIGVQFAGRFGEEAGLFRLAAQLEEAQPWAGRVPTAIPAD